MQLFEVEEKLPDYPYCQRSDQFLVFKDVSGRGSGFLHKSEDFLNAWAYAIWYNRTLVDYTPSLTSMHSIDSFGRKIEHDGASGWSFGMFFDMHNVIVELQSENVST